MLNITQKQWVENILISENKITRNRCLKNYISRLGAIISMLKKDGYEFEAETLDDARHWVINHLDCSCEWNVREL